MAQRGDYGQPHYTDNQGPLDTLAQLKRLCYMGWAHIWADRTRLRSLFMLSLSLSVTFLPTFLSLFLLRMY